jgi:hypothetical protein
MRTRLILILGVAFLAGCNQGQQQATNQPAIRVRGPDQDRLHQLNAMDLAIGLKRAIYANGYSCKRVTDAGFVGTYQNLDIWEARCSEGRDWALFTAPDGSVQVRDCRDMGKSGFPACEITRRPKGSFSEIR